MDTFQIPNIAAEDLNGQRVNSAGATRPNVRFYRDPLDGTERIVISNAADTKSTFVDFANEQWKRQFPREYEAYKLGADQVGDGTRLDGVVWIDRTMIPHLQANGILTIEQLAALDDAACEGLGLMGLAVLRDRAKRDVSVKSKAEAHDEIAAENERLREQVAMLMANQRQKPGPKPKQAQPGA